MKQDFVTLMSPGSFFSEETVYPVDSWDPEAVRARVKPHHFALRFHTRERGPDDLDSRVSARSGVYYVGGEVYTLEEVERQFPECGTLIRNMRNNDWARAVRTRIGNWQPFDDGDTLLNW
jgi:hypothetical protein